MCVFFQLLCVWNNKSVSFSSPSHFHLRPPPITVSISRRRALWGWGSVMVTMVPGGRYVCSAHAREEDSTNDREERILAVLGIIGTILNLLVVIFVYIYTSVTWGFSARLEQERLALSPSFSPHCLFKYLYTERGLISQSKQWDARIIGSVFSWTAAIFLHTCIPQDSCALLAKDCCQSQRRSHRWNHLLFPPLLNWILPFFIHISTCQMTAGSVARLVMAICLCIHIDHWPGAFLWLLRQLELSS